MRRNEKGQGEVVFSVIMIVLLAVVVLTVVGVGQWQAAAKCANTAEIMGVEYQWGSPIFGGTGCMIQVDGRWMPLDAYYYNPAGGAPPQ